MNIEKVIEHLKEVGQIDIELLTSQSIMETQEELRQEGIFTNVKKIEGRLFLRKV